MLYTKFAAQYHGIESNQKAKLYQLLGGPKPAILSHQSSVPSVQIARICLPPSTEDSVGSMTQVLKASLSARWLYQQQSIFTIWKQIPPL